MENLDHLDTDDIDSRRAADAQRLKLQQQQEVSDFKWLMSHPAGRRIVWRQLGAAGVFQSSFDTIATQMAFNEGRRSEGLRLLAQVHELTPDLYPVMMKEQACPTKP